MSATRQPGPKPSDRAVLQLQAAQARSASPPARRYGRENPPQPPRPVKPVACPGCGAGCREEKGVRSCSDCGQFTTNGAGGWAQIGHSGGVACREVLGLQAAHWLDLAPTLVVLDQHRGKMSIDPKDPRVAESLRGFRGTVADWLEERGQWLRGVEGA